ncbi:hypothetical protein EDM56_23840 [Brevibacillus fluminis]|uniref:PurM-like N-terminal domain-containing protein n=1 Tax=Brevibacillus fluminis TaxID=511487 RepID=A0A3M8D3A6_9BACL|nr:AIR synthase related protein [Brevibacillus fluminis]RNB82358.1 hypothetical protein EDM56_23840 [Brevibacillus fluminis]
MSIPYISNPLAHLQKVRDLTVIDINETQYMVVACDSDGGIGTKELDVVQVPEEVLGAFAVRVPLFELIASGAVPMLVVDCLSVEMDGTGEKLIRSIKAYAARAGLLSDDQFTGSTEDNVPTRQTGIGITVLGLVDKASFYPGKAQAGDVVVCAGIPKSAPQHEVRLDDPDILRIEDLIKLRNQPAIGDMLPVGSKGLRYEANQLALYAGLSFIENESARVALDQSGGPSTCVLFVVKSESVATLAAQIQSPLEVIGTLQSRT